MTRSLKSRCRSAERLMSARPEPPLPRSFRPRSRSLKAVAVRPLSWCSHNCLCGCGFVARRLVLHAEHDFDLHDSGAFDLEDVQAEPVRANGVPDLRCPPELAEDEPGHRVEVLLPELRFELLVEVVDRVGPVDADAVLVDPLDGGVRKVELVLDVADDLLEQILEGD